MRICSAKYGCIVKLVIQYLGQRYVPLQYCFIFIMNAIPPHFHLLLRLIAICPKSQVQSPCFLVGSGKVYKKHIQHNSQYSLWVIINTPGSLVLLSKNFTFHTDRWNRRFILAPLSFPLSFSTKTLSSSPYLI